MVHTVHTNQPTIAVAREQCRSSAGDNPPHSATIAICVDRVDRVDNIALPGPHNVRLEGLTPTPLAGETRPGPHSPHKLAMSRYVAAHLGYVHAHVDRGRIVISVKQPPGSRANYLSQSFSVDDLDAAARHAAAENATGLNVFYRVHLIDREIEPWQRGQSKDTTMVTHFAADVDIAGPGHKPPEGRPLPPDIDTAVELIDNTLPPSLIINSGGGLYPIWRLAEVVEVRNDDDRRRIRNIGRRFDRALASHGWHVDATVLDLARVIRPAGVVNYKPGRDPRPVTVLRGYGVGAGDYRLDDLERLLPELPEPEYVKPRKAHTGPTTGTPSPWELFAQNYTIEDVLAADPRHRWERVRDQGGMPAWKRDGSEADYSIKLSDTGVIIVWSSVIAAELGIDDGSGLDLWGFAVRLAGRDPAEAAKAVKR